MRGNFKNLLGAVGSSFPAADYFLQEKRKEKSRTT
jgi:hypothetical protein